MGDKIYIELAKADLTAREIQVMLILIDMGAIGNPVSINLTEIGKVLRQSRQQTWRSISSLVNKGFVVKIGHKADVKYRIITDFAKWQFIKKAPIPVAIVKDYIKKSEDLDLNFEEESKIRVSYLNENYVKNFIGTTTFKQLTETYNCTPHNPKSLLRTLTDVYNTSSSNQEFAKKLNISYPTAKKIIELILKLEDSSIVLSLKKQIGQKTYCILQKYFRLSHENTDRLIKNVYELWHEKGTQCELSNELEISHFKITQILSFIQKSGIIKNYEKPKKPFLQKNIEKTQNIYRLYKELGTLEEVGKKLGVSRERVRQLLEKGDQAGVIEYKPTYLSQFDELTEKINKKELQNLIIEHGSIKDIVNYCLKEYGLEINDGKIQDLISLYQIDFHDFLTLHRKRRCQNEYDDMVQQLGYHPTTTVMQKTSSWRALWARISRLWGGDINNFRREFGIPIPKPGSPTFKEDTQKGREQQLRKLRDQKKERFKNILELIEEHELISIRELLKNLDISKGMIGRHMKELRDTEQVDWLLDDDGKTYMYFLMEN